MAVIKVTYDNFEKEVIKSDKPVLVDFNADWCGPCRMLAPTLDEIAEENDGIKVVSVNVDDEPELAEDHEISSIPCLIVYKNGEIVNRSVGLISKNAVLSLLK